MHSYVDVDKLIVNNNCRDELYVLYQFYIMHKYDLLGSGYTKVDYKLDAKGFHGRKYIDRTMALYGSIIKAKLQNKCTADYEPINWFVDYKSGFFFAPWKYMSEKRCYEVMDRKEGVDIKCPWELGRLYHLLQLSVLAIADQTLREGIVLEFRNEITDFIEANPVGRTVQWTAPMDVSIRMVNMLLSYDMLMQLDRKGCLDKKFQISFEQHIDKSLRFLMEHLEYQGRISANHYLSNIAGIIFAAAYLPESSWTDACLAFGVQELIEQTGGQFYEEGSNFEGSTSYHRLSAEFALYSTALIYGILKTERRSALSQYDSSAVGRLKNAKAQKYSLHRAEFFPGWFTDRLCNAGIFTSVCLKDNAEIVQIGDNDSGRLLKLTPVIDTDDACMKENVLDHNTLLSAMYGIFQEKAFLESTKKYPLESSFVDALSGGTHKNPNVYDSHFKKSEDIGNIGENYPYSKETVLFRDNGSNLLEGVEIYYFEKFGLIVLKGSRLFVSMVIDTAKNAIYPGHTHNDKLSVEIMVDGKYITRDSGTYVYTAASQIRDQFRSVKAHNTICIEGREQNPFEGVWGMKRQAKVKLLQCTRNRVAAKAKYGDVECLRDLWLTENTLIVKDYANKPFCAAFHNIIYSDGYGKIRRVKK